MSKYSYITDKTHNNRKIQVESAKRDGSGKNIENNYAKQNGNYQSLTAGLSNNFDTKQVMVDESAYNFRPTATMGSVELEVGSPCKVKKIVGGSVAFNQLLQNGDFSSSSGWSAYPSGTLSVANNICDFTPIATEDRLIKQVSLIQGHKYFIKATIKTTANAGEIRIGLWSQRSNISSNTWQDLAYIENAQGTQSYNLYVARDYRTSGWDTIQVKNVMCIDLTQMFGSTIADYIYSLEQANAGSGVAWFKRYFPKEYYAYNSGELVSVKTQGKKITHFNQWDESHYATRRVINSSGVNITENNAYITLGTPTNNIMVIPNTIYHVSIGGNNTSCYTAYYDKSGNVIGERNYIYNADIVTPANAYYMLVSVPYAYDTYNHDICINFHYDGKRDGEYEPYDSETYACDDIDLRGIPQLDENNNLAFEGDEYANDGNVTRKYGIVDLGTLTWTYDDTYSCWKCVDFTTEYGYKYSVDSGDKNDNTMCGKYEPSSGTEVLQTHSKSNIFVIGSSGVLWVYNNDTQNSPTGYLVYELATPTDENSIPFTEVQECDNWGTEEWLAPTTDTRPCEVPVGHETDYLPDLKEKVEVAPNTPNENGVYVMEHKASGNSYTPIATWLTDNGYAKADTLPTKDSVGGTLRQLLAVKETLDFDNTDYVDLGTLTWTYLNGKMFADLTNAFVMPNQTDISPIVCTKYKSSSINNVVNQVSNGIITLGNLGYWGEHRVAVYDSNYTNATTFKNAMKGILLAYEKAS